MWGECKKMYTPASRLPEQIPKALTCLKARYYPACLLSFISNDNVTKSQTLSHLELATSQWSLADQSTSLYTASMRFLTDGPLLSSSVELGLCSEAALRSMLSWSLDFCWQDVCTSRQCILYGIVPNQAACCKIAAFQLLEPFTIFVQAFGGDLLLGQ